MCKYKTIIAYIYFHVGNEYLMHKHEIRSKSKYHNRQVTPFRDSAVQYYLRCDGRCWNLHICTAFCYKLLSIEFALIAINLHVKYNKHG